LKSSVKDNYSKKTCRYVHYLSLYKSLFV
jgi:hypothetical protein